MGNHHEYVHYYSYTGWPGHQRLGHGTIWLQACFIVVSCRHFSIHFCSILLAEYASIIIWGGFVQFSLGSFSNSDDSVCF